MIWVLLAAFTAVRADKMCLADVFEELGGGGDGEGGCCSEADNRFNNLAMIMRMANPEGPRPCLSDAHCRETGDAQATCKDFICTCGAGYEAVPGDSACTMSPTPNPTNAPTPEPTAAPDGEVEAVTFLNGWSNYGGAYGAASHVYTKGMCVLNGLIKGTAWDKPMVQLPAHCRPKGRQIWSLNNHAGAARIDVLANGLVQWIAGTKDHSWMSLSGIVIATKDVTAKNVPLVNGWANYGSSYAPATYSIVNGLCIVEGLIKGNNNHMATLPAECRPHKRTIYNLNNHGNNARVDVESNGKISWVSGNKDHGWISLTGIIIQKGTRMNLFLSGNWIAYDNTYSEPTYQVQDGFCALNGLIKNGDYAFFANLPWNCRPRKRLIFNLNNHAGEARVDVQTNGNIGWVAGDKDHQWISLAGVVFETNPNIKQPETTPGNVHPIQLTNGFNQYSLPWAHPEFTPFASGFCILQGLARLGASWGEIGYLPEGCRPTKRVIFNSLASAKDFRFDVEETGRMSAVTAGAGDWMTFGGVIFQTDASKQKGVPLVNGWAAYGGGYKTPTYSVYQDICTVEGLIKGTRWGHVATLPAECRPNKQLIFNLNNHGNNVRVDVVADGRIITGAGNNDHGWVSLSGIVFQVGSNRKTLALTNGWVNYGGSYGAATYQIYEGVCSLEGLIKNGAWSEFTTLPVGCRPKNQLVFDLNNHAGMTRANIYPDGRVLYGGGTKDHAWVSLSGIIFKTELNNFIETKGLSLQSNWVNYGGGYGGAEYTMLEEICIVDGLVKNGDWNGYMARLPVGCRPNKQVIFNLNNHGSTARVDVRTDGLIDWVAGGKDHSWISLGGIAFQTGTHRQAVPLVNNWVTYGGGYGSPTYVNYDGFCTVEGLIKSGTWGHMATLPADCRPNKRLIFNLNNHASPARVDVLTNGQIHYITGGKDHGWMSLGGIMFQTGNGHKTLPMSNGWSGYGGDYSSATYKVYNKICTVEGLIKGNNWGLLATLPAECRPRKRIIYNLNNHGKTCRVDVATNGQILWVTGGKDHSWVSLTGIVFATA